MSDDLFSYVLSNDKTKLKIEWHETSREYSADEVAKLAIFFANLRADMSPAVPEDSRDDKVNAACDRYEIYTHPTNGTAQVYLRIPGFGWSFTEWSKEQCAAVVEMLNPPAIPPDTTAH